MTFQDIHLLLALGKTFEVVFTKKIEELETLFDENCKATLTGHGMVVPCDMDACAEFVFNFSKYEEENKQHYKPNYYDHKHNPRLYVYQTDYYPASLIESVWFLFDQDVEEFFTIIKEDSNV